MHRAGCRRYRLWGLGIQSIRILPPQPAIQQHHLALRDVIAKTESPRAKPGLAFPRHNPLQFLDRVFTPPAESRLLRSLPPLMHP